MIPPLPADWLLTNGIYVWDVPPKVGVSQDVWFLAVALAVILGFVLKFDTARRERLRGLSSGLSSSSKP